MTSVADIPLAITGMACRLPGAEDLEAYWRLLSGGGSQLGELPPERFNAELYYHPEKGQRTKSYTKLGGYVPDRPFDRERCPLDESLIRMSHKVHLKLCEVAAEACRHAGFEPFAPPTRNVGVYIGHTPPSALAGGVIYARQVAHAAQYLRDIAGFDELVGGQTDAIIDEIVRKFRSRFTPDHPSIEMCGNAYHAAALITRGFKLNGPSMAFDAACASSLRALGHGARALQLGQIDMALIGGASYVHSDCLVLFSQAQSVSTCGTRPFDADADGLVASEGYVVLCLKTLERALADEDRVLAVIRGIGISSDGKGKSLWAPRSEGQIEAMRRAYGPGISLDTLQYIEMHATSTQVGDATEMTALTKVLGDEIRGRKVPVGSVKANVGHTLETAGLASLVKTVLAMNQGVIPHQINVRQLNPTIDWDAVPFYVPLEPAAWPSPAPGRPRRAAVNAFGIGGLNVHVVLDEHLPEASRKLIAGLGRSPERDTAANRPSGETRGDLRSAESAGSGDPRRTEPRRSGVAVDEPIAIVGRGAILPGVRTIDALWDVLRSGQDQKTDVPPERWDPAVGYRPGSDELWTVPTCRGGFITGFEYDWKKHKVPPKQIATADPLQFMLLDAADQALKDAGYHDKPLDKLRTGVVVGTIFGGEFADQLQMGLGLPEFQRELGRLLRTQGVAESDVARVSKQYEDLLLKRLPALVDETGSFTASTLASRITKTFDLMGGAVAVDSGDASSMAALNACVDLLRAGDCDVMICAAGHRSMGFATYESLARTGQLAHGEPRGPFDAASDGTVPGEGVGVVILKRLADAERDGDRIHGIIRGLGVARDESLDRGLAAAVARAAESARVRPEQVSVVEAVSSGIPQSDRAELGGILQKYGSEQRDEKLRLGALAAQFGNLGGASGMTALLKSLFELNQVEMAANAGPQQPVSELAAAEGVELVRAGAPLRGINDDGRLFAGVNAYSQALVAYHVIVEGMSRVPRARRETAQPAGGTRRTELRSVRETQQAASPNVVGRGAAPSDGHDLPWRIMRIARGSQRELLAAAAEAVDSAAAAFDTADRTTFSPQDRFRLAIVAGSADELAQKLRLAAAQGERVEARGLLAEKGIFFGDLTGAPARLAFLFPGQGSQYDGMLRGLVSEFAPARAAMAAVDRVLSHLQLPSFATLAWEEAGQLGRDVWRTQLSLMAADTIMAASVEAIGLRPERVAGHSFGELAALVAAGAWTFEDAIRGTSERCRAIEACTQAAGVMLSTSAPAEAIEALLPRISGRVSISHRNSPEQTVCGGNESAVRALATLVEQAGYKTKILDVPAAFHTPLMEEVKDPFRRALAGIPLAPPLIPLLSSVTNRYVSDPDDIRENLVVQMTQPVHWTGLIERLAGEGFNVFVEVGPKHVLSGLAKNILAGRNVTLVATDHPKRPGCGQLLFARAAVEASGALDARDENSAIRFQASPQSERPATAPSGRSESESPTSPVLSQVDGCVILRLAGTPFEMGFAHGRAQAQYIRHIVRRYADLAGTRWDRIRDLDTAVANAPSYFGPEELEEMRGIAKGADVSPESVIAHNLRLYLDAGAGGLHFAVTAEVNRDEGLIHAANEDLQMGLCVLDCLARNIQVRHPAVGIPHVTFGVAGQVGTLNGINAHGIAVTTSALVDHEPGIVPPTARLHTVLVKNVLEQAADVDSAVDLIRRARSAATWSVCLSHHAADRLCYVEFDGRELKVQPSPPAVLSANHRLLRTFPGEAPPPSARRLERLKELLGGDRPAHLDIARVREALRDQLDRSRGRETARPTINTVRRVDNQISIVMQPGRGRIWATAGPLANGHQNEFLELDLNELLPKPAAVAGDRSPKAASAPASLIAADDLIRSYDQARAAESQANGADVCQRYVMRVIESPLPDAPGRVRLRGPAVVLGENAASRALAAELRRSGIESIVLPAHDHSDEVIAVLDRAWQSAAAPHLFLMTAFDDNARTALAADAWHARRRRGVLTPYFVCQRWYQLCLEAGLLPQASIVAATALGGDFGFSGRAGNVESGALAGLVKGVEMELRLGKRIEGFQAHVIDFEPDAAPHDVATAVVRELAQSDGELEAGYIAGRRYVPRPAVAPLVRASEQLDLPTGGVVIVTGGARGVTAEVARELGRRFDVKLHLIGSSPVPEIPAAYRDLSADEVKDVKTSVMKEARANGENPLEAWAQFEKSLEIDRNLRSFAEDGLQATYHACDISNRKALGTLLDAIRAADGPIYAVVHGAGYERAASFEKKQTQLVERTIAAKVDGAAALLELTAGDPLRYFAAFGSVSGRFGGVGQTDYCLANEMLAKLIDWHRAARSECRAAVFHWHAWDDVGMAVRPESKHIAKLHNIRFMPAREGTRHLVDELLAGLPEPEIVVTELQYCLEKYGAQPVGRSSTPSESRRESADGVELRPARSRPPMIDAVAEHVPGRQLTAEVQLDPTADLFLVQHKFKGRPMLPVVATLETLAESAMLAAGNGDRRVAALRNIEILNGLRFLTDDVQTARTHAAVQGDEVACDFTCDFLNRRGQLLLKDKPYLRAVAELTGPDGRAAATKWKPAPRVEPESWTTCWYPEEDVVIWHGPAFRCLREIAVEGDEAFGRLVAPPPGELAGRRGGTGWLMPSALLDACFFACGIVLWWKHRGVVAIPDGIERIDFGRLPRAGEKCLVHIDDRGRTGDRALFDFAVFAADGSPLFQVEGYRNVIVAEAPAHAV